MGRGRTSLTAAALLAAVALGVGATQVIGDDGSAAPAERIAGFGAAERVEMAPGPGPAAATAAGKRRPKKPQVNHLVGPARDLAANGPDASDLVFGRCPKRQVPVTGGAMTSDAGVTIDYLARLAPDGSFQRRAFFIGVSNITEENRSWIPTLTCMKRVTEG